LNFIQDKERKKEIIIEVFRDILEEKLSKIENKEE
jgi:hypothetical protein